MKVTVPVGVRLVDGSVSVTVAVKVTGAPKAVEPDDWMRVVEVVRVGTAFTSCSRMGEFTRAKAALPL